MTTLDLRIVAVLALAACGGETDGGAAPVVGGTGGTTGGGGTGIGAAGGAAGTAGPGGTGAAATGGGGTGAVATCNGGVAGGAGAPACSGGIGDAALSVCKQRAEAYHASGCDGQSAMDFCVILFGLGKCSAEVKTWAECIPACYGGYSTCSSQQTALTQCLGCWPEQPPYVVNGSTGSDGSCHSGSFIAGFPGPFVEADCAPSPSGQFSCTCSIDATTVGNCQGAAGSHWSACELYVGCCSQFWQCLGPPKPPVDVVCGYGVDDACNCMVTGSAIQPITTDCKPSAGGGYLCTCSAGGATLGTCGAGSGQSCDTPSSTVIAASDPFFGCCSQFW